MTIIVKIFSSLIEPDCGCINWMDHWEKATNGKRVTCSNVSCYSEDISAKLVVDERGNQLVIPLCDECASQSGYLEVAETQVRVHKLPSCNISSFVQMDKSK